MTPDSSPPPAVTLRHVEQRRTFSREGHVYADDHDRRFYVFTAGDGTVWSAAEVLDDRHESFGRFLVHSTPDRDTCLQRLSEVLARSGN